MFSNYFDVLISNIIFKKYKKYIILMYFQVKNTLKNNRNIFIVMRYFHDCFLCNY
jgi:hypothetical protein